MAATQQQMMERINNLRISLGHTGVDDDEALLKLEQYVVRGYEVDCFQTNGAWQVRIGERVMSYRDLLFSLWHMYQQSDK